MREGYLVTLHEIKKHVRYTYTHFNTGQLVHSQKYRLILKRKNMYYSKRVQHPLRGNPHCWFVVVCFESWWVILVPWNCASHQKSISPWFLSSFNFDDLAGGIEDNGRLQLFLSIISLRSVVAMACLQSMKHWNPPMDKWCYTKQPCPQQRMKVNGELKNWWKCEHGFFILCHNKKSVTTGIRKQ